MKFSVEKQGEEILLLLSGVIDESAELSRIPALNSSRVTVDLSQVTMINSIGIREWIKWTKTADPKGLFVLRGCPRAVIDQANIVKGFISSSHCVESFFVPLVCSKCDSTQNYLMQKHVDFRPGSPDSRTYLTIPARKCPNCNANMEMDVLPERYFSFLDYRP